MRSTSADLRLEAGEFAVPGGERALFAVLAGKVEVVKLIEGIERTLGWRVPGTIFGEVPIALGTPFPGGYRAAEPSRVMRMEAQQYYALAAASPEIAMKVSALARERIGGLQGLTAEPPKPRVTMIAERWDAVCGDLRRFLARNQITFEWVTPDSPKLSTLWPGTPPPASECPALRLADGTVLRHRNRATSPASRSADEPTPGGIRHRDRRRRAGGPRRRGLWRVRRPPHDGDRA